MTAIDRVTNGPIMTGPPARRALDVLQAARATGERVQFAREQAGVTQAELGHVIGRSASVIRCVENGQRLLTGPELVAISRVLGVGVPWLRGSRPVPPSLRIDRQEVA